MDMTCRRIDEALYGLSSVILIVIHFKPLLSEVFLQSMSIGGRVVLVGVLHHQL